MLGIERRRKIMERLEEEKKVYVTELAKEFQVTEETIRRDLERLEKEDLLCRSYGGAVLSEKMQGVLSFARRSSINTTGKDSIASAAAALITDGTRLMLDASTTCQALLPQLKERKDIVVLTNSAQALTSSANLPCSIISSGGLLRPHSLALTGPVACRTLSNYCVDFAFISCKGLDLTQGVMESSEEETAVKQVMLKQARHIVLLADASKFDHQAFLKICPLDVINTIITDSEPPTEWQKLCADQNIRIIVAEKK